MIFISVCFNRFGYPRSAPSILYDILVGANLIVVLSHPFYVYRLVYPYFKINRYTFCRNFFGNLGLQLFCKAYLSFTTQKRLTWLFECQVEWLKLVRPVMRNWYHIAIMFFNQNLYLVRPLSFKHISNQKPLFGWTKIKLFFFLSDIR